MEFGHPEQRYSYQSSPGPRASVGIGRDGCRQGTTTGRNPRPAPDHKGMVKLGGCVHLKRPVTAQWAIAFLADTPRLSISVE